MNKGDKITPPSEQVPRIRSERGYWWISNNTVRSITTFVCLEFYRSTSEHDLKIREEPTLPAEANSQKQVAALLSALTAAQAGATTRTRCATLGGVQISVASATSTTAAITRLVLTSMSATETSAMASGRHAVKPIVGRSSV